MSVKHISIPRDFDPAPAGRTHLDGPFNGTAFRERILIPALEEAVAQHGSVEIDFDDADSYSSSFLEEVFGGLARLRRWSAEVLRRTIKLKADDPVYAVYVKDAESYLAKELARQ